MSSFTQRLRREWGGELERACRGSIVPQKFLAGLVSVENAHLAPEATRFEPGVFRRLKSLRDRGGKPYNGIVQGDLADASDAALRALATSYGLTQIMGWSMVHMLEGAIEDLRDPEKHLAYAVERLDLVARKYLRAGNWEAVLRIWNSGSPTGETYDPHYVPNALAMLREWEREGDAGQAPTPPAQLAIAAPPPVDGDAPKVRVALDESIDGSGLLVTQPSQASADAAPEQHGPDPSPASAEISAEPVKVTSSTASMAGEMVAWVGSLTAIASAHVQELLGLSPEVQRVLLYFAGILAVVWFAGKSIAHWQIRKYAADQSKTSVK